MVPMNIVIAMYIKDYAPFSNGYYNLNVNKGISIPNRGIL